VEVGVEVEKDDWGDCGGVGCLGVEVEDDGVFEAGVSGAQYGMTHDEGCLYLGNGQNDSIFVTKNATESGNGK
jgi:hypothetical protein